jgi:hypothetical protein
MSQLLQNGGVKSSEVQTTNPKIYSAEEIKNISSLGDIFKGIRARLKSEGTSFEIEREKLLERVEKSYNKSITYEERTDKTS